MQTLAGLMKNSSGEAISPLKMQAADALRRARKLPIGPHRNDLRQLALGLRHLDQQGIEWIDAAFHDREAGPQGITGTRYQADAAQPVGVFTA